jgi:cob(I)alamin adenosyltransferase
MKKSKIYTKTGDKGETALVSGTRISKADERINLYGELDELNSRLGVAASFLAKELRLQRASEFIHSIQSSIFDLGSQLACEADKREGFNLPKISLEFITDLEEEIDRLDHELDPLKNFILPGGGDASAQLHLARTQTRKVERKFISFIQHTGEEAPENAAVFLNRLSDYLFVLARHVDKVTGVSERLWKPKK